MNDAIYTTLPAPSSVAECHFYHWMDIPGHGLVEGDWDLRGGVADYLGHVALAGRRVLEIGPASGFLTFHMESQGAEVVAVELAPGADWDIVPHAALDLERVRSDRQAIMDRLRNGFWFAHQRFLSRARVHYGSAYHLPAELGRFDIAVMAAVLLHVRDPLCVIANCAKRADCLVITDLHDPQLDGTPAARLYPRVESDQWDTWWTFSPDLIERFLRVLGYSGITLTHHVQTHSAEGRSYPISLFTIVAERPQERYLNAVASEERGAD